MPPQRRAHAWPAVVCALAILAVFGANVARYWSLGDDAFISFRYARHLGAGLGLVWNPGERVEGYTNFLWVLLMAAGMKVHLSPERLSNVLGVVSGLIVLAVVGWLSARRLGWRHPLTWLTPACLALNRSFAAWTTGGLETQAFSALILAAHVTFSLESEKAHPWPFASSLLFATACLMRPEGLLFAGIAGVFFAAQVGVGRRTIAALVAWGLPVAAIVGAHALWRHSYYGFWLPNTFYAKVGGFWWAQGLAYFGLFESDYHLGWFLPVALLAVVRRKATVHGLLAAAVLAHVAYLVAIGGDRFEFRLLVVDLPALYWLVAEGIDLLPWVWPQAGLAALLLLTTWFGSERPGARRTRHDVASVEDCRRYGARRAEDGRLLRELIDSGTLPADVRIAVGGAGAVPYYTDWYTVDVFGINDVTIAHAPLTHRGVPGHEHSASWDYLRQKQVAIVDVLDGFVLENEPERIRRKAVNAGYRGPLECLAVADHALVFATGLPPDALRRVFPRLEPCAAVGP